MRAWSENRVSLGIDRDSGPLAAGRARARELNLSRVTFAQGDFYALSPEHGQLDGAVRRVLMYQSNPIDAIRRLANAVRPGGLVVFQEHDSSMVPVRLTPLSIHEALVERVDVDLF